MTVIVITIFTVSLSLSWPLWTLVKLGLIKIVYILHRLLWGLAVKRCNSDNMLGSKKCWGGWNVRPPKMSVSWSLESVPIPPSMVKETLVVVQLLSHVWLLWPHGPQPVRLLCPWDSPGKNTGVGCHSSSRESSQPRDQTHIPCIGRRMLYHWVTREARKRFFRCD